MAIVWRTLKKAPGAVLGLTFSLAVSGALGGALADRLLSQLIPPAAVSEPERLIVVEAIGRYSAESEGRQARTGPALSFADFQLASSIMSRVAVLGAFHANNIAVLSGAGPARKLCRVFVTSETLEALSSRPVIGRSLTEADFREQAETGAMLLSDRAWREVAGPISQPLEQQVWLDEQPFRAVGVLPAGAFEALRQPTDVVGSAATDPCVATPLIPGMAGEQNRTFDYLRSQPDWPWLTVLARLRPTTTESAFEAALELASSTIREENPGRPVDWKLAAVSYRSWRLSKLGQLATLVALGLGLVIFAASLTTATLLLVEIAEEQTELTIRMALGARVGHIVRLMMTRALAWSCPGLVFGLVGAPVVGRLLDSTFGEAESVHGYGGLLFGWLSFNTVLCLAVVATATAVVAASLVQMSRHPQTIGALGERTTKSSHAVPFGLLAAQIVGAITLVSGVGIITHVIWNVVRTDFGFQMQDGYVAEIRTPGTRYGTPSERLLLFGDLLRRASSVPGVIAAGISSSPPLTPASSAVAGTAYLEQRGHREPVQNAAVQFVKGSYFAAMGLPFLAGRAPTDSEADRCVVIDETLRRRLLPSGDALEAEFQLGGSRFEVCGVVPSTRANAFDLAGTGTGSLYLPLSAFTGMPRWTFVVIRTYGAMPGAAAAASRQMATGDSSILVQPARSFSSLLASAIDRERRLAAILAALSLLALTFAATSTWATLQRVVTAMGREIAIRMCLGCNTGQAARLVAGYLVLPVAVGLCLGGIAAVGLARWLGSISRAAGPLELDTLAIAVTIVIVAVAATAYGPVVRATRVSPAELMRSHAIQ